MKGKTMLHSYEAELQGNQVIWLGAAPPAIAQARRVVVVLEDSTEEQAPSSLAQILRNARGSLGRGNREAVLAELARSRQEWEL
ncbi:hypothetical protein [Candidatus Skiveiella danica]|jgi:hypothetical protein|uniref:hypothetical protein n=1 Tax=Candidatus Skiveiella danica TaxID=3386177 RepID=UPI0039B82134